MKYDIVLCPSLKKNWIHYNMEIHEAGGKKTWDDRIGNHYSTHYAGYVDYPAFRPDHEMDLEELFNEEIDVAKLLTRYIHVFEREVKDYKNNINSITIRNPIHYCLKSKLVWQEVEDDKNPTFSEKLIDIKEYKKGSNVNIAECQEKEKRNYDEGGSVEISRKTIKEMKERYDNLFVEEEKTFNTKHKEFKDHCYYEMIRLMDEN